MRKLTSLALAAALTPALALGISTVALADEDRDDSQGMAQDRDDEQGMAQDREHGGDQQLSSKPQGAVYADDIIGQSVKSRGTDEEVGEVTDLVIGQDGRIAGVIVSTGGVMGLGEKDVALPWDRIQHTMEDDEMTFTVDMDEDELENAPEYERDE